MERMKRNPLRTQLFCFLAICAAVYLGFRYLLPLLFPFLLAWILMQMLFPVIRYLHTCCHWPKPLAGYSVLSAFFLAVCLSLFFLGSRLWAQLRLFLTRLPENQKIFSERLYREAAHACHCLDHYFQLDCGASYSFLYGQLTTLWEKSSRLICRHTGQALLSCVSSSFRFFAVLMIIAVSMIILVREMEPLSLRFQKSRWFEPLYAVFSHLKKSGLAYLRTELLILLVNAIVCSLSLFLIRNPYFFLLGIGIALFDAFPVVGSGMILLPWCLVAIWRKSYLAAVILAAAYLITLLVRELLEAKLLGDGMGISPFFMLFSIFAGIRLFGVCGLFLGPFAIVLVRAVLTECQKAG